MIEGPFKNQEELTAFVAATKAAIERTNDQTERLKLIEQASTQFRAGLDAMKADLATRAKDLPMVGGDGEVIRSFYAPHETAYQNERNVADLRKRTVVNADRGHTHVGSDGGIVRLFGSKDEAGVWEYGLLDDPAPKSEWQAGLQERLQNIQIAKAALGDRFDSAKAMRAVQRHIARGPSQIAKVFSDNAGEGGEWIVTIPLTMLERTAEMSRILEAALPSMNVSGGSTFTHPFLTTGVQPFLHGQPVAGDNDPAELPKSVPVTGERTITIKTMTVNVPIDMDAAEDSILDAMSQLSDLIARADVDGTEDALINGDLTATHGDTAFAQWNPRGRWQTLGSTLDHRRLCTGFRHQAIDRSSTIDLGSSQTVSSYMAMRAGLTQPHGLGDLIYVTSPEHYLAKILLDTNLLTVDKYGSGATILTGEVGKIGGRALLLSEFMTADLADSGLFTATGAKTGILLINRSRYRMVRRRSFRINVTNMFVRHTSYITASSRKALHTFDGTSVKNVRYGYNLASS